MSQLTAADIQSVAVLASWCDSGSHLGPVPKVEEYLSSPEKQQLCQLIAEQISPTTPLDPSRSQRPAAEGPGAVPLLLLGSVCWWEVIRIINWLQCACSRQPVAAARTR
jgi:hypothetical protein